MDRLREQLVDATLAWERAIGIAPAITASLAEYDAAALVGFPRADYAAAMHAMTDPPKGHDFVFNGARYLVMGNRPSVKRGGLVTWVPKAASADWDVLVWILYDSQYDVQEAWQWEAAAYAKAFATLKRLSPAQLRRGKRLVAARPAAVPARA